MPRVVIPDDAPVVMASASTYPAFAARHQTSYFDTLPGDDLAARCRDAEVVINIRSSSRFTDAIMAECPSLRLISIWGTGTDNIDLAAARRRGIAVTNTPGVSAPSIAEHTIALMFAVARKIPLLDSEVRHGKWPRGSMMQLTGKTLGVIGLGAIGQRVARLGLGLGMRVLCWTMHPRDLGFEMAPLERVLAEADVLSLHLRLSEETRGFLGSRQLAMMKRGAILVNTARGPIVDEAAMIAALQSGQLRGAGLDVFDIEPLPPRHPLTTLENVVISPHCAGITPDVLEAGLTMALTNIDAFFAGRPENVV